MPDALTATVSKTGTPSSSLSFSASIAKPRLRATSLIFSDTTIGRFSVFSSKIIRSVMRRLVASATAIIASGGMPSLPTAISRATASSGLVVRRLYVPGKSMMCTAGSSNSAPSRLSTVTPG